MNMHHFALLIAAVSAPLAVPFSAGSSVPGADERETLPVPVMRAYPRAEIVDTLESEFQVFAPAAKAREEGFRLAA